YIDVTGCFIVVLYNEALSATSVFLGEKIVFFGLFDDCVCMCTSRCLFLGLLFQAYSGLLVQGQRRSFEIGKDGGPTLFTKSFDCGVLGGLPRRSEFLHLFPTFGRNCQFHKPAAPAAPDIYQTATLQGPEIPHERPAIHPKPSAYFRDSPL